jgi:CopG family transcriptional regulator, nickel-responsive regulator
MAGIVRLSISLEKGLFEKLERLVEDSRYTNRSEYLRDLIRQRLVEQEWADQRQEVIGTITMVYDHHARLLSDKLVEIQHEHHEQVLAATHVHLSRHLCAEMIMVRGSSARLRALVDRLRRQRGVLHAELGMSTTGNQLR